MTPAEFSPEPPFLWPEPRVIEGEASYAPLVPFDALARASSSVTGVVTAPAENAIDYLADLFQSKSEFSARLIVSVYPTCPTRQPVLDRLRELAGVYRDRLVIRIRPSRWVTDRPSSLLCFLEGKSGVVHLVSGSSESLGFDPSPEGKINFVFRAEAALLESFQRYFTWLWAQARDIRAEGLPEIPDLALPPGSAEAARRWDVFYQACQHFDLCSSRAHERARIDPVTGGVTLVDENGTEVTPPGVEVGLPPFDPLADRMARLYAKGVMVAIDKLSRVPPLDSPLDPALFGDAKEIQHGGILRKVSMRVSIIDAATLKEIEKRRKAIRGLLEKFTFRLADSIRWLPHTSRPLLEAEIGRIDSEGRNLIADLLKGNAAAYIEGKMEVLVEDVGKMYSSLGGQGRVPQGVVDRIRQSLTSRLARAEASSFMPKLTYTPIEFGQKTDTWASPWGQAYALLSDIAAFPRKALTSPFFFLGLEVSEDDLLDAMNVADDQLVRERSARGIRSRCKRELDLLRRIEEASIEPREKCDLVHELIRGFADKLATVLDDLDREKVHESKTD